MPRAKLLILTILSFFFRCLDGRTILAPKFLPAKISSQWSGGQLPGLAYNGNTDARLVDNVQCICTAGIETVPWWMLDLLLPYRFAGVKVWNRLDVAYPVEVRFTQISLGVSSSPSVWTSFNESLFKRCFYYTGTPTAATNPISLTCPVPFTGRYLALYKNRTGLSDDTHRYINFCEVDVYILDPILFEIDAQVIQPSYSASSTSFPLAKHSLVTTDFECLQKCVRHEDPCQFVLFLTNTLDCWLFESSMIPHSFMDVAGRSEAKFLSLSIR